jgi:electron transfer flavoprotein alpha subunit
MVESIYNVKEEKKQLLVFLEQRGGAFEEVSLELLSRGRELADHTGWSLVGLLLGHNIAGLAQQAIAYGADKVLLADHHLLELFTIEGYSHVAYHTIIQERPSVFLSGATVNGRDLAGRLAVRLRTGLNADCTDLYIDMERGVLVSEVSGFGGGVLAMIEMLTCRPQMATVRPGVFPRSAPDPTRKGEVIALCVDLSEDMIRTRVVEHVIGQSVDLTQAEVLVVGGRGMGGDYKLVKDLADCFGGEVGATRPPVDEGHIDRERMVGQTGTVCRPKLAVVCGVSGAFHFVVGIQNADQVIAINLDPDAPIFDSADYCIVGDAFEILPELIKAVQDSREVRHA